MKLRYKSILFIILVLFSVNFVIATEITSCGTISSPGVYELAANIRASSSCIVIASDHVNIDGTGGTYTLTGNNTYTQNNGHAIAVTTQTFSGFENITIRNFVIRNFSRAIYTYNARNWTIFNNTIYATESSNRFHDSSYLGGQTKAGILMYQGAGINISSNYINVNSSIKSMGIYFHNVTENMLKGESSGGVSNYIEFNDIVGYSNGSVGLIELSNSDNVIVRHNKVLAMDGDGGVIYLGSGTNHSTIEHNNVSVRGTFVRLVNGKQVRDDPCISLEGMSSYNKVQFNNCTSSIRGTSAWQNRATAFKIMGATWNNVSHNIIITTGENVTGLSVFNAVYNLVEGNKITMKNNTNNVPLQIMSWMGNATGNNFVNNTLFTHSICDSSERCPTFYKYTNDLVYLSFENSYGLINWTSSTLSTRMNMSFGKTIFIESNNIGVLDHNETMIGLNKTATIKFKGLSYSSTPNLLKSGTDCDGSVYCNISYNSGTGVLTADISSFSNYTTSSNDADAVPEFGDYAMFLILITLVSGFLVIKKKENT